MNNLSQMMGCRESRKPRLGLLKIAQQLQCWVRDASRTSAWHYSSKGTKEMFCRPWRDFMNGVRLSPTLKYWAIFEDHRTALLTALTPFNAYTAKSNGLCNARFSKINVH